MPHYRVLLHGSNFWLRLESSPAKFGFYLTRFVHALDPAGAGELALEGAWNEPKLQAARAHAGPDSSRERIDIEELEEVEWSDVPKQPSGFVYYDNEDEQAA